MICGTELTYAETANKYLCVYCGTVFDSQIICPNGHFVCDTCHSADAVTLLEKMAESEESIHPKEIVESAFIHPSFSFHGPEHHSLVPAAILISLKNRNCKKPDGESITVDIIKEGINRGSKIPGGFCGYAGTCGACVGAGVAIALFLGSTPTKGSEKTKAHEATTKALTLSQDGLVRCCKRATFYGISTAMGILKEEHNIDLGPIPENGSCKNYERNRDCAGRKCYYFPDK
jgi:hypothetical protein